MFSNTAVDVVIGLVFIYLLYSLLATVLTEIVATNLGLRARNLKEAVDRMLNDEDQKAMGFRGFWIRLWDSMKLLKNPCNPRIINFYNHPEIKYLGSTGIFRNPSAYKAISFSRTLLYLLNETGYRKLMEGTTQMEDPDEGDIIEVPVPPLTKERIEAALLGIVKDHADPEIIDKDKIVLDVETAKYVLSMWRDSYGDLTKFKIHLETWFDRTMEQATEWYKRKIQVVLLLIGLLLAWFFNADTFSIVDKLSNDKDAREQMVRLAAAYMENNREIRNPNAVLDAKISAAAFQDTKNKVDSLLLIQKQLEADVAKANSILGAGAWLPDVVMVKTIKNTGERIFIPEVDEALLRKAKAVEAIPDGKQEINSRDKIRYFIGLLGYHFFGFFVTAIAISLGAPFWFDLLNKLMRLRSSAKQPTRSNNSTADADVSPIDREA
jgi:hypothetical protein